MKSSSRTTSQPRQGSFRDPRLRSFKQFGGSLLKNSNPKQARSLSTKHAMHLVLRSSIAKGPFSLRSLKNQKMVHQVIQTQARKYGIKIYEFANVGNHLHLLIKLNNRHTFAPFIRAVTGIIALKVLGASKLQDLKKVLKEHAPGIEKFWDFRPWTRIVEWKKAYRLAKDYIIQNHLEAIGLITYRPRDYHKYFKPAPA